MVEFFLPLTMTATSSPRVAAAAPVLTVTPPEAPEALGSLPPTVTTEEPFELELTADEATTPEGSGWFRYRSPLSVLTT